MAPRKIGLVAGTGLLALLLSANVRAEQISLVSYLDQVRAKNDGVKGAQQSAEGAEMHSIDGSALFMPAFFASARQTNDARPTLAPAFQGTKTLMTNYSAGFQKSETFGLQTKLHYDVDSIEVMGALPTFLPLSKYYDARPVIDITMPFWNNGFGSTFRAQRDLAEASSLSKSYQESFQYKMLVTGAEMAYYRLALARKVRDIQTASRERAVKLRDWSARRARLQLADKSDLLQAEAALQIKDLDLRIADEEIRAASRAFNSARGISAETVSESLQDFDDLFKSEVKVRPRKPKREDVLAAEQAMRATDANARVEKERGLPNVDLTASYALYGRDAEMNQSFSKSMTGNNPYWTVGLRVVIPLDVPSVLKSRQGWLKEQSGAEMAYRRKVFETDQEWKDLQARFEDAKKRLDLAVSLEEVQKDKLTHEKARLDRGRSTLYQVLIFEQDYAQARLMRVNTQSVIVQTMAQIKQFQ